MSHRVLLVVSGYLHFQSLQLPQILTSMSSVVGEDSCTLNHGGELNVQQELVEPHPLSISQGVTVWIEITTIPLSYAWLTEVALTHKWSWGNLVYIPSDTEIWCTIVSVLFIKTSSKAPDVLIMRGAICNTKLLQDGVNWHHTDRMQLGSFNTGKVLYL